MAPSYKLTYFDIMGMGEPIRILLSYGNFDFEDCRVHMNKDWPKLKPSTPFGQVPILEFGGKTAYQTVAICRYLAKQVKLVGSNDWEDLQIDAAVDTVNDFRQKMASYHYEADQKRKEEMGKKLFDEIVPFYIEKLDAQAKQNGGYLAVNRLTWADLFFMGFVDYINFMAKKDLLENAANLQKVKENVLALPSVRAWIEKRPTNNILL